MFTTTYNEISRTVKYNLPKVKDFDNTITHVVNIKKRTIKKNDNSKIDVFDISIDTNSKSRIDTSYIELNSNIVFTVDREVLEYSDEAFSRHINHIVDIAFYYQERSIALRTGIPMHTEVFNNEKFSDNKSRLNQEIDKKLRSSL